MTKNTETRSYTAKVELAKTIFEFSNEATPAISNYNRDYAATYGQYPDVRCYITVDKNSRYQLQQMPQFTLVDGLIGTIYFDMGGAESGCLVLS